MGDPRVRHWMRHVINPALRRKRKQRRYIFELPNRYLADSVAQQLQARGYRTIVKMTRTSALVVVIREQPQRS